MRIALQILCALFAASLWACAGKQAPPPAIPIAPGDDISDQINRDKKSVAAAPATTQAFFVGKWSGKDKDGWLFNLEIRDGERFIQEVVQTSGKTCQQSGTARLVESQVQLHFETNTCNTAFVGVTEGHVILSATPETFELDYTSYTIKYTRR